MSERPYTTADFIDFQLVSIGVALSMPDPQKTVPIPEYHRMTPGMQFLTRKMITEMGYEVRGTDMFNPRFTFWQKIRKSLWMRKPS